MAILLEDFMMLEAWLSPYGFPRKTSEYVPVHANWFWFHVGVLKNNNDSIWSDSEKLHFLMFVLFVYSLSYYIKCKRHKYTRNKQTCSAKGYIF